MPNASSTEALGASHGGYVFGACAILRAKKPPQPAVFNTKTGSISRAHNSSRINRQQFTGPLMSSTVSVSRRVVAGGDDTRSADSFVRAFGPLAGVGAVPR